MSSIRHAPARYCAGLWRRITAIRCSISAARTIARKTAAMSAARLPVRSTRRTSDWLTPAAAGTRPSSRPWSTSARALPETAPSIRSCCAPNDRKIVPYPWEKQLFPMDRGALASIQNKTRETHMRHMTRLLGAAVLSATAFTSAPVHAEGGTLVIASSQVPRHLNGAVQSGIATAVPSTQIFASPLRYDENWEPQPYLAESWQVSDDGMSVTLNLVQDATFHDGEPI